MGSKFSWPGLGGVIMAFGLVAYGLLYATGFVVNPLPENMLGGGAAVCVILFFLHHIR